LLNIFLEHLYLTLSGQSRNAALQSKEVGMSDELLHCEISVVSIIAGELLKYFFRPSNFSLFSSVESASHERPGSDSVPRLSQCNLVSQGSINHYWSRCSSFGWRPGSQQHSAFNVVSYIIKT